MNNLTTKPCQCETLMKENAFLRQEITRLNEELEQHKCQVGNESTMAKHCLRDNNSTDNQGPSTIEVNRSLENQLNDYRARNKEKFLKYSTSKPTATKLQVEQEHLKDVIEERDSLRTAINAMMQEQSQGDHSYLQRPEEKRPWKQANKKRSKKIDVKSVGPGLKVSNQFKVLKDQVVEASSNNNTEAKAQTITQAKQSTKKSVDKTTPNFENVEKTATKPAVKQSKKINKKTIAILGDSILRDVKQAKVSNALNARAYVKSFSGAKIEDMQDYCKPILRKDPQDIVLHVGTNDIPGKKVQEIVNGINQLCKQVQTTNPDAKITVSELIMRDDNEAYKQKIIEVNEQLQNVFNNTNISILRHSNVDKRGLDKYGLHLNQNGSSLLVRNFIQHLMSF